MLEHSQNQERGESVVGVQKQDEKTECTSSRELNTLKPSPPNMEKRTVRRLGKYQFSTEQRLGSGMSGDVYVGIDTETFQLVCVKVVDRTVYKTPQQKLLLENEIRCQQACTSQFTIAIKDIFDTSSFCFIVTQFCQGGDLYRLLRGSNGGLPESLVVALGKQIAAGLGKLRAAGVIHRDIKSENILLQRGVCKLGDFGFAIEENKLDQHKFNLGSPLYMSLQALESSTYSYASDVFAFGVVLYEMLHRQSPWECSQESQLIARMKSESPVVKSGVSMQLKELILSCLNVVVSERPSIQSILVHPALNPVMVNDMHQ